MAVKQSLESLVDNLTLEEQVSLLSGEDDWTLPAISRLGIGKLRVTDGPNGARGGGSLIGGVTAAAFPVGIALGASWNPDLLEEIGTAIAQEVKTKCAHVALAPTVNLQRSVSNGRNFECYAEDPELSAALAVAYIKGLQSQGVAATIKHFAGNESEIERTTINSEIDEVALREIYLRPFEDAVKKAGVWAIMSSYNKLNGTYTAENHWLLTTVLREQWGYDGIVMSDWFGSRSTAATVNAGLDLEMPGPTRDRGEKLVAAVARGEVSPACIRERALNILRLLERTGALSDDQPYQEQAVDLPAHRALIRRAGIESTVLLKNNGILPIENKPSSIAVIGPNAAVAQIMGGGSSQLNPHYRVSPLQALTEYFGKDTVVHSQGCTNHRWEPLVDNNVHVEFYDTTDFSGDVIHAQTLDNSIAFWTEGVLGGKVNFNRFSARLTTTFTPSASGQHVIGLHAAAYARLYVDGELCIDIWDNWQKGRTFFEEGCDEVTTELDLSQGKTINITVELRNKPGDNLKFSAIRFGISRPLTQSDIDEAAAIAAKADLALVFVGRSGEWDTEGSDLLDITLPGRQDDLVAAVTNANPQTVVVLQTGGPTELPWIDGTAAVLQAWYPGQECGNAIVDVLTGQSDPSGRLPQTFPAQLADNPTATDDPLVYPGKDGKVVYREGLLIGYRHYLDKNIKPLFPFGFGLSYTSFDLSSASVETHGEQVLLKTQLSNTGKRQGSSVVQVYTRERNPSPGRPALALKTFAKAELDAGETRTLTLALSMRDFAFFDQAGQNWQVKAGDYEIAVGFSVDDLRHKTTVTLPQLTLAI